MKKWKYSNIILIVISVIALFINYIVSDGNIDTYSLIEEITIFTGILIFVLNIVIISPLFLIIVIIKKEFNKKLLFFNFVLIIVHIIISMCFIVNYMGRATF